MLLKGSQVDPKRILTHTLQNSRKSELNAPQKWQGGVYVSNYIRMTMATTRKKKKKKEKTNRLICKTWHCIRFIAALKVFPTFSVCVSVSAFIFFYSLYIFSYLISFVRGDFGNYTPFMFKFNFCMCFLLHLRIFEFKSFPLCTSSCCFLFIELHMHTIAHLSCLAAAVAALALASSNFDGKRRMHQFNSLTLVLWTFALEAGSMCRCFCYCYFVI